MARITSVTYYKNDGTSTSCSYEVLSGTFDYITSVGASGDDGGIQYQTYDWSRAGYTFIQWNTSPTGDGTEYYPGDPIPLLQETTVYAIWAASQITYYKNDGTGTFYACDAIGVFDFITSVGANSGSTPVYDWSRSGYNFLEWNTSSNGSGTSYYPGSILPTADTNVYAIWQEIIPDITISYNNSAIVTVNTNQTTVLNTANTYLTDNITIQYTKSNEELVGLLEKTIRSCENSTVTTIGTYAFYDCSQLGIVSFPNCSYIAASAFTGCTALAAISFPICQTIGNSAFLRCSALGVASFPLCSTIYYCVFQSCTLLTTASFPACTVIYSSAFKDCQSLTTAYFPSCTSIHNNAFYSCYNLESAVFPMCSTLNGNAFAYCSNLSVAIFPVCTYVGTQAFASCRGLTMASFSTCSGIGSSAFIRCSSLLSLYLFSTSVVKLTNTSAFLGTPISNYGTIRGSVFVRASLLDSFKAASNWSVYSNRIVGLTDAQIAALG